MVQGEDVAMAHAKSRSVSCTPQQENFAAKQKEHLLMLQRHSLEPISSTIPPERINLGRLGASLAQELHQLDALNTRVHE
jgi:hypothetical protein